MPLILVPLAGATNFLVVVVDDLGFDKLSSYEAIAWADEAPTWMPEAPTFDGLAEAGLRFANVYASPVCSPTRAGLLTGRHPYQHDVSKTVNDQTAQLSEAETTLGEVLQDSAYVATPYATGMFGKWHLGVRSPEGTDWDVAGEYEVVPPPNVHGLDVFAGILAGQPYDYYGWTGLSYPEVLSSGATGTLVYESEDYAGELAVDTAYDWITAQSGPWLAWVMLNSAHADEEDQNDGYEEDDLPPGWGCDDLDGDGACGSQEIYLALLEYADEQIGGFLTDLAATPDVLEDTLIVVMGDNGTPTEMIEGSWAEAGERTDAGKNSPYETGSRVPLILVRGCDWLDLEDGRDDERYADGSAACTGTALPLAEPGLTLNARVMTVDLFATLNSLAGSSYVAPDTSVDLSPCLTATSSSASNCGIAELTSRKMYTETFRRDYDATNAYGTEGLAEAGFLAVKRGNYKLIGELEGSGSRLCVRWRFFDLGLDPYETNDLRTGGDAMSRTQFGQYLALRSHVRNDVAPEWLPSTSCR